ncbi:hypothetical protein TTHERM_00924280 (macronuclear) [Tetrahymena thermophila SB210]|uniref:Uncharacterized protein n=1 Tax=Tetrahymena thermophila (strain SB210) TaxID=312017 RepID=Q23WL6_TETTS|nr:hypothetical protein TTHERM_00924280 [Tetrahymena thermophila SB210]EAS00964.2 hypothetical protein TTHERM_00924280 [Tetrahymena thermophila SB210]|eukprot:XP_001021209.2 hypothetical protein TTHERM_00924280 [Tetrahymena thermophila SB210]
MTDAAEEQTSLQSISNKGFREKNYANTSYSSDMSQIQLPNIEIDLQPVEEEEDQLTLSDIQSNEDDQKSEKKIEDDENSMVSSIPKQKTPNNNANLNIPPNTNQSPKQSQSEINASPQSQKNLNYMLFPNIQAQMLKQRPTLTGQNSPSFSQYIEQKSIDELQKQFQSNSSIQSLEKKDKTNYFCKRTKKEDKQQGINLNKKNFCFKVDTNTEKILLYVQEVGRFELALKSPRTQESIFQLGIQKDFLDYNKLKDEVLKEEVDDPIENLKQSCLKKKLAKLVIRISKKRDEIIKVLDGKKLIDQSKQSSPSSFYIGSASIQQGSSKQLFTQDDYNQFVQSTNRNLRKIQATISIMGEKSKSLSPSMVRYSNIINSSLMQSYKDFNMVRMLQTLPSVNDTFSSDLEKELKKFDKQKQLIQKKALEIIKQEQMRENQAEYIKRKDQLAEQRIQQLKEEAFSKSQEIQNKKLQKQEKCFQAEVTNKYSLYNKIQKITRKHEEIDERIQRLKNEREMLIKQQSQKYYEKSLDTQEKQRIKMEEDYNLRVKIQDNLIEDEILAKQRQEALLRMKQDKIVKFNMKEQETMNYAQRLKIQDHSNQINKLLFKLEKVEQFQLEKERERKAKILQKKLELLEREKSYNNNTKKLNEEIKLKEYNKILNVERHNALIKLKEVDQNNMINYKRALAQARNQDIKDSVESQKKVQDIKVIQIMQKEKQLKEKNMEDKIKKLIIKTVQNECLKQRQIERQKIFDNVEKTSLYLFQEEINNQNFDQNLGFSKQIKYNKAIKMLENTIERSILDTSIQFQNSLLDQFAEEVQIKDFQDFQNVEQAKSKYSQKSDLLLNQSM